MESVGRKLARHQENPFDNVFLDITERANPLYYSLGLTPNHLTVFSGLLGAAAVWAIYSGHWVAAGWLYLVSYYFDVADGNYARTYKMVSKFGDILDHVKDVIVVLGILAVFLWSSAPPFWYKVVFLVIQAVLYICMTLHLSCQERIYNEARIKKDAAAENESPMLETIHLACRRGDPHRQIAWTRWGGCGTFAVITSAMLMSVSGGPGA